MEDQSDQPCTLQDVVSLLRDQMRVTVTTTQPPYASDWLKVKVEIWLGEELITDSYDEFLLAD